MWVAGCPPLGDLADPGIKPKSPCLLHWQTGSLPLAPPGEPELASCACVLSHFSHVQLLVTLWTVARQAPRSMGFSRQGYWSGLLCPPPRDLPDPGIEPTSLMSPALAGGFFSTSTTQEAHVFLVNRCTWGHLRNRSQPRGGSM